MEKPCLKHFTDLFHGFVLMCLLQEYIRMKMGRPCGIV
jgi:hypothetical protein